jgi:hypothetical protein
MRLPAFSQTDSLLRALSSAEEDMKALLSVLQFQLEAIRSSEK